MARAWGVSVVLSLLLATSAMPAGADDVPPSVPYADASGSHIAGLGGVGIDTVDHTSVPFTPNATHARIQFILDYEPAELTADVGPAFVGLAYEYRLDLRDSVSNETVTSFAFAAPGQRFHTLNETLVDGRSFVAHLYLVVGADVDWSLRIFGWRPPEPL